MNSQLEKQLPIVDRHLTHYGEGELIRIEVPPSGDVNEAPNRVAEALYGVDQTQVRALKIRCPSLFTIPPVVRELRRLRALSFQYCPLGLGETDWGLLAELEELVALDLSVCTLNATNRPIQIPDGIRILGLAANGLEGLEQIRAPWSVVRALDVSQNQIGSIATLPQCAHQLRVLYAGGANVTSLSGLSRFVDLEKVVVYDNAIKTVPEETNKLTKLQELDLNRNQVHSIPWQLGELPSLTELYLHDNPCMVDLPSTHGLFPWVGSAAALREATPTHIRNENALGRFETLQTRRLLRSARELVYRALVAQFEGTPDAGELREYALALASTLEDERFQIMASDATAPRSADLPNEEWRATSAGPDFVSWWSHKRALLDDMEPDPIDLGPSAPGMHRFERHYEGIQQLLLGDEASRQKLAIDEMDLVTETAVGHAAPEMQFRDFLRGLVAVGAWRRACIELSAEQLALDGVVTGEPVSWPAPPAGGASMRVIQLTNNDPLGLVLVLPEARYFLRIDSPSIAPYALAPLLRRDFDPSVAEWMGLLAAANPSSSTSTLYRGDPETHLWQATFGARVITAESDGLGSVGVGDWVGRSVHEVLQTLGIRNLKIIPVGSFNGMSLSRARMDDATFALDHYKLTSCAPWSLPLEGAAGLWPMRESRCLVIDGGSAPERPDLPLPFASAEVMVVAETLRAAGHRVDVLETGGAPTSIALAQVVERVRNAAFIHVACHSTNQLQLATADGVMKLSPSEVSGLDLKEGTHVFCSSCTTSQEDPGTIVDDDSIALAFLRAGAKWVVSTTTPVIDADAFRIGCRYYELVCSTPSLSPPDALHAALCEARRGMISTFGDRAKTLGRGDIALVLEATDASEIESWRSYVLWEHE